jgi:HD superfamily phosphohydrolase
MRSERNIRDPIHGFVTVEGRELDVLDTPLFQRLRRIHQLAMARLVYPGALHTRFDHTLGVLHVAGRLCRQLQVDDHHTKIIRLAALLHDIGHGPFSHVSESILTQISGESLAKKAGKKDKIHELITQQIILESTDLDHGLSHKDREEVIKLLRDGLDQRLYRDIVSGPLDADKQDYLLRDSYFCGVSYGVYDMDQLHNTLTKASDAGEDVMVVTEAGVHSLEQFVLAKYYLTTQVYRHKVRLISDSMLVRCMMLGVEQDKLPFLETLFRFPVDDACRAAYLKNYLEWDDQRLSNELLKPEFAETAAGQMFRRLIERKLFKRVISLKTSELVDGQLKAAVSQRFTQKREELEAEAAAKVSELTGLQTPPSHIILHLYKIDSVRTQARNDEAGVLIKRGGRLAQFDEESVLFQSINASLRDEHIDCYAPLPECDEKKRRSINEQMRDWLLSRLKHHFDNHLNLITEETT